MNNYLTSINPYNLAEIQKYKIDSADIVQQKITHAEKAFNHWKQVSIKQRADYVKSLSDYIIKHKQRIAILATQEMGKPLAQSLAEVDKSAWALKYYAENGSHFLENEIISTDAKESFVTFQPLGVILAIMPWNYPFWQVFRAMGPILMAGNSMLLKHASNVTGCALAIHDIVKEAGLPKNIFQTLIIPSSDVENVIKHTAIKAITFTGSTEAGAKVAAMAATNLKKQVLELGGSDAYIILADADLPNTVEQCVHSRMNNTGQSCISAKRFIVEKSIARIFTNEIVKQMKQIKIADPTNIATQAGPMARLDLRDSLHLQVMKSIEAGAELLCGGYIPEGNGAFYPPTVLGGVCKGMPAFDEELFGPVAAIITAEDENDAINIANDTPFGLGGAIFSRDIEKAKKIASYSIEAGSVFVNGYVSSDPRLPFGGIKNSGYGRELSNYAIKEFVNIKSICVK